MEQATLLGQAKLSGGPLKQPHAEPSFETLYILAHRDRRHAKLFRGAGKTARRNGSHEPDDPANAFNACHDSKP
jgi:hypothetical protein